jgi:hypothetical protein
VGTVEEGHSVQGHEGAGIVAAVVNDHVTGAVIAFPYASSAWIDAVYPVLSANGLSGVNTIVFVDDV